MEDKYRQAYGFMEGWLNTHFKKSSVLTEADRVNLLRAVYKAYGLEPVSQALKREVVTVKLEDAHA